MSATSEELAAQAEQLQASIAFFRINTTGNRATEPAARRSPAPVRAAAAAPARKPGAVKAPAAKPGKAARAPARNSVAELQSRVKGFALDLSMGGPDAEDAQLRRQRDGRHLRQTEKHSPQFSLKQMICKE